MSTGFAAWSESLRSDESDVYGGRVEGRSTGIATAGDLSIGGMPTRGLVVAVSLQATELLASTFRQTDASAAPPPSELDPGLRALVTLGPTFLYYPNDEGGFFFEAGLAFAALSPLEASPENRSDGEIYAAVGLALPVSAGFQFFFADQFSAGVRGRFTGAALGGEDAAGVEWVHLVSSSPTVLFDLVWN